MKKFLIALSISFAAVLVPACGSVLLPHAPPNLTPQVEAKFYATSIMQDLDKIRNFAASLARTTPPTISKATALAVVDWHEELVALIHEAPGGWKAIAIKGLNDLPSKLPSADVAKFRAYIDAAKLFIQEAQ